MYQKLIKNACYLGVFIFIVNILANKFYWYTSIFGFDKFMHFLGGVFIVLIVASFFLNKLLDQNSKQIFIILVLSSFIVGLFWEYYEYIIQEFVKNVHLADIPDSIGDLFFDCLGGIAGSFFVISMNKRYNNNHELKKNT